MQEDKFYDIDDYTSKITESLQVVGTENKAEFTEKYLNNKDLRAEFKLIGTHSDCFHCDEVMATSLLLYTKEFEKSIIVRTRDQEILDKLDIQCDVGGVFDPENRRFDHHQKTFVNHWWEEKDAEDAKANPEAEQRKPTTKLSSAGLIYKYYGQEIISNMCKTLYGKDLSESKLKDLHEKIYKILIMEIDAIDNGVD